MIKCKAKPYEGKENFIFISYSHKDKEIVFPIIEKLTNDGYRVWYDEGIDPGTEWPEIIANHLNGCAVCIAFVSENYIQSHNCRREINFAIHKNKYFISVILEQVELPLGMEMQLSTAQSVFKYLYSDEKDFYVKLYETKEMGNCKKIQESATDVPNVTHILKREKTGENIIINKSPFKIGRSKVADDYVLADNSSVSRGHATINIKNNVCYIVDNGSLNKTYVNGMSIVSDTEKALCNGDKVRLSNENFEYVSRFECE